MLIDINQNWVAPIRFRPSITDSVVDIKPLKKSLYFQIPPGDILYQSPSKIHLTYNDQYLAIIKAWDTTLMKRCQGLKWINQSNNSYHSSLKPPSMWKWKTHHMIQCWNLEKQSTTIDMIASGDCVRLIVEWTGLWKNKTHWGCSMRIIQIAQYPSGIDLQFNSHVSSLSPLSSIQSQPPTSLPTSLHPTTTPSPPTSQPTTIPSQIPTTLEPYFKMQKMGIPIPAIKQKMTMDGLDPGLFDNPESCHSTTSTQQSPLPKPLLPSPQPSLLSQLSTIPQSNVSNKSTSVRNLLLSDIKNTRLHQKKFRKPSTLPQSHPQSQTKSKSGGILSRFIPPSVSQLLSLRSSLKKIKG